MLKCSAKPNLPTVDLQETPTATLEVFIMSDFLNQWQDVQNLLNYLGLQLPEIRRGQVISPWNFRTYDIMMTNAKGASMMWELLPMDLSKSQKNCCMLPLSAQVITRSRNPDLVLLLCMDNRGSANETARNATLSHETQFDRQKLW